MVWYGTYSWCGMVWYRTYSWCGMVWYRTYSWCGMVWYRTYTAGVEWCGTGPTQLVWNGVV